ncbi:hypothetical protein JCM10207_001507 [Rhodosporidiobolus poonsookiae]
MVKTADSHPAALHHSQSTERPKTPFEFVTILLVAAFLPFYLIAIVFAFTIVGPWSEYPSWFSWSDHTAQAMSNFVEEFIAHVGRAALRVLIFPLSLLLRAGAATLTAVFLSPGPLLCLVFPAILAFSPLAIWLMGTATVSRLLPSSTSAVLHRLLDALVTVCFHHVAIHFLYHISAAAYEVYLVIFYLYILITSATGIYPPSLFLRMVFTLRL